MPSQTLDCLVVGGGPAGLAAAWMLLRLHRRVLVADEGASRVLYADTPLHLPGETSGVTGAELLARLRAPVEGLGGEILAARVAMVVQHVDGGWAAQVDGRRVQARTVLLATGVTDDDPDVPGAAAARRRGLLRQCPICDGHEHAGARIGVIGPSIEDGHAQREAAFLARFGERVLLLGLTEAEPGPPWLGDARVRRLAAPLVRIRRQGEELELQLRDGSLHGADVLYAALGVQPRSTLAVRLGARRDAQGHLVVDAHGRTSVPRLYAAGDVVRGLDQVVVAQGLGTVAAVAIHNDLAG